MMAMKSIPWALYFTALTMQVWGAALPILRNPSEIAASSAPSASAPSGTDDVNQLREQIAKQEQEIKRLEQSLEEQRGLLDKVVQNRAAAVSASAVTGQGIAPIVVGVNIVHPQVALQHRETMPASPLSITIGNTRFTALGFVDATFFGRSTNVGSGIGTNFGSIPYATSATNHLSESNFSTQNSRIGFRVDSNALGGKLLGYFEADFLGNQPTNVFVSSNSDTVRMRNVFVDWQKGKVEFLAGQDWSFATPNRKGLSPLPSDIFYTQNMDTNYQAGLVWSRQTQFRLVVHPADNLVFGVSFENPQQYIGGSSGGSSVTLPSALSTALSGGQFNNGSSNFAAPNLHPDIIFKSAYDGHAGDGRTMHVEATGIVRSFKDAIPFQTPAIFRTNTATAVSGEVNGNIEVAKGFRLVVNTFFGAGNGRYVFGQAPDVVVRADGSISPLHTYSTVDGFEYTVHKNTLLYGYYGGIYIGRDVAVDADGRTLVGYGYAGSPNSQNRAIQEGTVGVVQTFWKSPIYGALSLITQYTYLTRDPWAVVTGSPKNTHANMYWVDLRYTLP
jgi:hypothetical protein